MSKDILVIGAGAVGMCTALFLQRDGHQVTVLDQREPGAGCSFGNAGFLSPGTSSPKATPNMLRQVPSWLFDPAGPLKVRANYALKAAPWLWQFIRAGRPAVIAEGMSALLGLHEKVFDLYGELTDTSDLIRRLGQMHIFETDAAFAYAQQGNVRRRARGITVDELNADEARQIVPDLGPAIRHALFFPDNGHIVSPFKLVTSLAEKFSADGGEIVRDEVRNLTVKNGVVSAVHTATQTHSPSHVVIAAGAWSATLATQLGDKVPLESQRGYHLELTEPGIMPKIGLQSVERKFTITPMEGGLRLAGTAEFAGLDAEPNYQRADVLFDHANKLLPGMTRSDDRRWMGHRPCIPDSLPVIGPANHVSNVHYAFGHGHTGMSGSPMTGKLISDMIAGRTPSIDAAPFRLTRF
jgi:glycine/D-amino acid oxidase-like deaminating enzyme